MGDTWTIWLKKEQQRKQQLQPRSNNNSQRLTLARNQEHHQKAYWPKNVFSKTQTAMNEQATKMLKDNARTGTVATTTCWVCSKTNKFVTNWKADCERYNYLKNTSRTFTFWGKAVCREVDEGPSLKCRNSACSFSCALSLANRNPQLSYQPTLVQNVQIISALNSSNIRFYCKYCRKHIQG